MGSHYVSAKFHQWGKQHISSTLWRALDRLCLKGEGKGHAWEVSFLQAPQSLSAALESIQGIRRTNNGPACESKRNHRRWHPDYLPSRWIWTNRQDRDVSGDNPGWLDSPP